MKRFYWYVWWLGSTLERIAWEWFKDHDDIWFLLKKAGNRDGSRTK